VAVVGYARVSTDGQTLDAQHAALKTAGAEKVFAEKVSGAKADRRQLQRAIGALGAGDVLLVTRLDRLARSTRDLLNVLAPSRRRGRASAQWPIPGPTLLPLTEGLC
jgi:DNA invertase Pin-like site-specific DNA recombinase